MNGSGYGTPFCKLNIMEPSSSLERFISAQEQQYAAALAEIRRGKKQSHWIWYIFPQIAGLGYSETSRFYAITDVAEARAYLQHPVLGSRLKEISGALLHVKGKTANQIFGSPDDMKLQSSMTLFAALPNTDPVFQQVLDTYFDGAPDQATLRLIETDNQ